MHLYIIISREDHTGRGGPCTCGDYTSSGGPSVVGVHGPVKARTTYGLTDSLYSLPTSHYVRVLDMPVSCWAYQCTKRFVKGGDTEFFEGDYLIAKWLEGVSLEGKTMSSIPGKAISFLSDAMYDSL